MYAAGQSRQVSFLGVTGLRWRGWSSWDFDGAEAAAHSMSSELSPIQESAHGLLRWRCSSLAHLTGQQWVAPVLRDSLTKPPGGLYGLGKGQGLLKRQLQRLRV